MRGEGCGRVAFLGDVAGLGGFGDFCGHGEEFLLRGDYHDGGFVGGLYVVG